VHSKDNGGRTPHSWAVENGHVAVVKLLLVTGKADVDSKATEPSVVACISRGSRSGLTGTTPYLSVTQPDISFLIIVICGQIKGFGLSFQTFS
jgi:ankyrin repeat protein